MKCRACWTDKAYLRHDKGFKAKLYSCLGFVPLKCHHCFHKTWAFWFTTWGQTLHPPKLKESAVDTPAVKLVRATASRRAV
jgi:hypothetical protein